MNNEFLLKIKKFDSGLVKHTAFLNALDGIKECIELTKYSRESVNCTLLAGPGCGKTALCGHIIKSMPESVRTESDFEFTQRPVIYAECPSNATPKKLASVLLHALGDNNPEKGSEFNLTERIIKLLRECRTVLLLLDEIHNLLSKNRTSISQKATCQWLKGLINRTNTTICLVGVDEFSDTLDAEISRRFLRRYTLGSLSSATKKDGTGELQNYFKVLANTAKDVFELDAVPNNSNAHFIKQLWVATGGIPSYVSALIKTAIHTLHRYNKKILDIQDLSDAWETGICREVSVIKTNPFTLDPTALSLSVGGVI
ncbi:MAG: AAA family ATPase [Gammaproteobacteria bacterium]|nr:MAG: AAA family ATPase [Gammaproteobacteria bacterium]